MVWHHRRVTQPLLARTKGQTRSRAHNDQIFPLNASRPERGRLFVIQGACFWRLSRAPLALQQDISSLAPKIELRRQTFTQRPLFSFPTTKLLSEERLGKCQGIATRDVKRSRGADGSVVKRGEAFAFRSSFFGRHKSLPKEEKMSGRKLREFLFWSSAIT